MNIGTNTRVPVTIHSLSLSGGENFCPIVSPQSIKLSFVSSTGKNRNERLGKFADVHSFENMVYAFCSI